MRTQISTQNFYRFILPQNLIIRISLLFLNLGFFGGVWGQLLLSEDFTSLNVNSNLATQNSWLKGGSGPDLTVANTSPLSYLGYNGGGGNYVQMPNSSPTTSRVYKGFTSTSAAGKTFYLSFLMNLSSVTATGDYFISLGDPATGSAYGPRLFAKTSGNGFLIGISKSTNTVAYGSTVYSLNTTYLIVVKLNVITGITNDLAYVWVNPSLSSEPLTSNAECSDLITTDAGYTSGNLGNFHWHNRSTNNPVGSFDGVRISVGTTSSLAWTALNAYSPPSISGSATTAAFTTIFGTASTAQSFSISGSNLTANLVATAPTGFEVSADGTTYGTTATYSQTGGSASGTLYIRLSASAAVGSYNSQNIVLSSAGATPVNITTPSSGNAVTCTNGAWIGGTSGNWSTGSNWCGGSVPTIASNVTIPSGVTVTLDAAITTTIASLTIDGTLVVAAGKQLTLTSTLTNNGTLLLQDGATFVQSTGVTSITGGGTFTVEKALSGNSSTWSSTSGRFWYMGVPMNAIARSCFGNYAAGSNRVWSYNEISKEYTNIDNNATPLVAGTGYVHRRATNETLTFSATGGNGLFSSDLNLNNLSRTSGSSVGFHLIANPYMAYLDWDAVIAANGTTNIESTYYIRSAEPTNNDALISYNSIGPNYVSGGVTSIDQVEDVRYIAPMQSVWVRVGTASATGSLAMNRGMLSHQSNNPGLKNTSIFPTSARVNLVDGARFDQILVFMNQDMSNGVDQFDSEKMFVSGAPQIYTMAAGKKLVMNGLKNNKKKISVPLYLELPESKVYNLQLAEYFLEDGLILLEDKQEGIIQDFSINAIYPFYANSGLLQNRFVLHFIAPDNGIGAQGPNNNWVAEETSYGEGGNILISSDSKGKVQITLDQPLTENITGMVQATDINGKIVFSAQLTGALTEFQMNVPSGIYYLSVQNGSIIQNKKVFVQN